MSLMDTIRAWLTPSDSRPSAARTLVVDAARLSEHRGGARLSPREQLQVLQQLARYAKQEGLNLHAAFEGRSLREVESGAVYNGVTVHFAENATALETMLLNLTRKLSRRGAASLVTGDKNTEAQALKAGLNTLRAVTLRRAMSGGGESARESQPRQPRRQRRSTRGTKAAASAPAPAAAGAQADPAAPAEPAREPQPDDRAVQQLIDLVE